MAFFKKNEEFYSFGIKKFFILIVFFYFFALIQTSFLAHFSFFGFNPNFLFILILIFNFLENPKKNNGVFAAFIGGFYWDIFSKEFLGFHALILLFLAFFIKMILRNYLKPVLRFHR